MRPPQRLVLVALALTLAGAVLVVGPAIERTPSAARRAPTLPQSQTVEAPTPTASVERVEHGADSADWFEQLAVAPTRGETLLHVRVESAAGQPIVEGTLDCIDRASLELTPPWRTSTRRVPIAGERTTVALAPEVLSVELVASAAQHWPGRVVVNGLRRKQGGTAASGLVEHEVLVRLDAPGETPFIEGAIRVDGRLQTPAGLSVRAFTPGGSALENAVATIDPSNCRYRIGPLPTSELRLLASSDETAPAWISAPTPLAGGSQRCDLELDRGVELELRTVDASTERSAPGVDLFIDLSIATWSEGRREGYDGRVVELTTDERGVCVVRGAPRPGKVLVARRPTPRMGPQGAVFEPGPTLLELDVPADAPSSMSARVRIDAAPTPSAVVWGPWPQPERFAAAGESLRVVARASSTRGDEPIAVTRDAGDQWSLQAPLDSTVSVWVETPTRRRVSETRTFRIDASRAIGPIAFSPLARAQALVRWSGGRVGDRVSARAESAHGSEPLDEFELTAAEGQREWDVPGACTLVVEALSSDQGLDARALPFDPAHGRELWIDWGGQQRTPVRVSLDGAPLLGASQMLLCELAREPSTRIRSVALRDGVGELVAALAPGRYFVRGIGDGESALVCGVLDVSAAPGELRVSLESEAAELPAHARGARLEALGELDLSALAPPRLRELHLGVGDPEALAAGPRRVRMPRLSRWSVIP